MSPGAIAAATQAGLGWIDQAGGAEVTLPGIVLARTAVKADMRKRSRAWTSAVLGTCEALLTGTRATVSGVHERTGLSVGSATNALQTLTELGHLKASIARGRNSGRDIVDARRLLNDYATAVAQRPAGPSVQVGIVGDLLAQLSDLGKRWEDEHVKWALTGAAGAGVIAPYLTQVSTAEVFVDASTQAELDAVARRVDLPVIDGGRVTLRPFPGKATRQLTTVSGDMRVAPWPRIYADLRTTGVRGEDAAEHLREAMTHD